MSGVDQKLSGTAVVKSVGERTIPWSQQVDEASYENLSSPANDDNSGNQSSMQFQFPPFNVKENNITSLSHTGKGRKTSHNNDTKLKYGNPSSFNNSKRENQQINAWNSRRFFAEKINENGDDQSISQFDTRTRESVHEVKAHAAITVPKKMTWASIASQPAKLTSKTTFASSINKKKGPGMPPPPMVPGKHNLDVNVWDLPDSNPPPPLPSPPIPIELTSSDIHFSASTKEESTQSVGGRSEKDDRFEVGPSNINVCSTKSSTIGQSRKNWAPLQQQQATDARQTSGASAQPIRRIVATSTHNRYSDRRGNFTGHHRHDFEKNIKHEYNDESNPRAAAPNTPNIIEEVVADPQILLDELKDKNNYNPTEIDLDKASTARFFVIKSYSEDDIHRSIKYEIWCSTDHGNKRLDDAFKERYKEGGNILLFFSVNSSGHFCGMAQMMTSVDYNSTSSVWSQDKWRGKFKVKWIYVKDVPNGKLRHIRLENNDNKPVTYSRDTQEVQNAKGIEVLQILHSYKHTTSIFDDFSHYEKKQEEEVSSKRPIVHSTDVINQSQLSINRHFNRQQIDDRERERNVRSDSRSLAMTTTQKNSFNGGNNFRDRNSIHKSTTGPSGFSSSYSDYRRGFERENVQNDRENLFELRQHGSNRKDDHLHSYSTKSRLNKREYNTEQMKSDVRVRSELSSSRDLPKVCINP
ncbi:YTH domain-containing family protein isoform X1 [Drosophila albomicans]|uniref:YTH domain-containing family protein isoform X1 n=1 Tax=Drosophila albomicans TaxID=7291 RepID=A0A6P8XGQ2_DROAB|nr:YTH domain-containing family protein isoform X1 [Drosophila albomicans]